MPSSLIFAALAAAWLVVLVPIVAKRRQEVVRITESALASRVLNRQGTHRAALQHDQEVPMMGEAEWEPPPDERRYRPGRGGYDPEAAELAARERYVFRQRVVLGMLVGAVATLVLGFASSSLFWWMHAALDGALVGYLGYLRRQVRIEQELRNRRAARMAGSRGLAETSPEGQLDAECVPYEQAGHGQPRYGQPACGHEQPGHEQPRQQPGHEQPEHEQPEHEQPEHEQPEHEQPEHHEQPYEQPRYEEPSDVVAPPDRRPAVVHPTAVALDLDDDDPIFDELDPAFEPRYRRAAGE